MSFESVGKYVAGMSPICMTNGIKSLMNAVKISTESNGHWYQEENLPVIVTRYVVALLLIPAVASVGGYYNIAVGTAHLAVGVIGFAKDRNWDSFEGKLDISLNCYVTAIYEFAVSLLFGSTTLSLCYLAALGFAISPGSFFQYQDGFLSNNKTWGNRNGIAYCASQIRDWFSSTQKWGQSGAP